MNKIFPCFLLPSALLSTTFHLSCSKKQAENKTLDELESLSKTLCKHDSVPCY